MSTENDYLKMQLDFYNNEASLWSLENKNPVVGGYDIHNAFSDYDEYLFKDFDTRDKIALEYGCGPGRNIIRFNNRFKRIDGVDISPLNIEKCKINIVDNNIEIPNLYTNTGNDIPVSDCTYDVIFSVICLQHICVHSIRYKIMKDVYRCLVDGGYFCFQMGFGGRFNAVNYYDNYVEATTTNSGCDVSIENEQFIIDDLKSIGFINYKSDLRIPCIDRHDKWIWIQVQK
jgi:SAM-dependent methyltransferase